MQKRYLSLIIILLFSTAKLSAQALGEWIDHLPYSSAIAVANGNEKIYCATPLAYFTYDKKDLWSARKSKANGLSDIGLSTIAYSKKKDVLIVAYDNTNIDLVYPDRIINISDIRKSNIPGAKAINHIYIHDDLAYLSCSFGIVVMDLERNEIKDTYRIGPNGSSININAVAVDGGNIYGASELGVYRASLTDGSNLLSYTNWHRQVQDIDTTNAQAIVALKGVVYAAVGDILYAYNGNWQQIYTEADWQVKSMSTTADELVALEYKDPNPGSPPANSRILTYDGSSFNKLFEGELTFPVDAVKTENDVFYIADQFFGLIRIEGGNKTTVTPNGPFTNRVFEMEARNGNLWVAPGGANQAFQFTFNRDGLFIYEDGWWDNVNEFNDPLLKDLFDIITVEAHPGNDDVYFGSFYGGLLKWSNGEFTLYDINNSPLTSPTSDPGRTTVTGLAFDDAHNLWISNYGTSNPIAVLTAEGNWYKYGLPSGITGPAKIVIDDFGNKWAILPRDENFGLVVFSEENTFEDESDDKKIGLGQGQGGLHTNTVTALTKDRDGEIWVGTSQGVTVFYCPGQIFEGNCPASRPLVTVDVYTEYLLENERINDIEVDGANRKWIATENGVWLMSEDGTEVIEYFTESNSPLFANNVLDITIDPSTGIVYFGTDKGIIGYKGTATGGAETHEEVMVYPNPVREDYNGPIAIKGLVRDANVKITDINGRLIYETTALGGQAIWNGKNYNGRRANTGVYLIFSTNADGTETMVTKLLFIN